MRVCVCVCVRATSQEARLSVAPRELVTAAPKRAVCLVVVAGVSCLIEASCVGCLSPQFADADGSGLISSDEFTLLLRSLIYYKECHADFAAIDLDHDRRISIEELMSKEVRSREKLMIC